MEQCTKEDDLFHIYLFIFYLRLSPEWTWRPWLCLASLSVLQQAEECDMAPCLQPGWACPHTQVRAGGHPESATVPVGCQAARLVKYH